MSSQMFSFITHECRQSYVKKKKLRADFQVAKFVQSHLGGTLEWSDIEKSTAVAVHKNKFTLRLRLDGWNGRS